MTAPATLSDIAVLIFDLDGTLVDSMDDLTTALNLTRADHGLPPLLRETVVRQIGNGSDALVRACIPAAAGEFERIYRGYLEHYNAHLLDRTCLFPGVREVLEHFAGRHLAVVTNKLERESRRILQGLGVLGRFGVVMGGNTLARKKPDPMQIRHVLSRFACAPERCVMVGDGINDMRAGRAAGVHTVAFTGGVDGREALQAEAPDFIIDRMRELIPLIS